ncbi:MAG: serine hydrolase [Flavobacteriaceae bacterium]|nr:serine hydrolase [Flavobacteriaceae bacterium]
MGRDIVQNPAKYKLQIIYTQINRDKKNHPKFTTYTYRTGINEYFYPASTIKIYSAALALEKINKLKIKDLDFNDVMLTDSSYTGQTAVIKDSTAENSMPSLAHYIKKIFIASDNDANNRLYEFIGQKDFNEILKSKGYTDTRITHRLSVPLTTEENRHTNGITFYDKQTNQQLYQQKPAYNNLNFSYKGSLPLGKGYLKGDEIVNTPMEFNEKNFSSLEDLHHIILSILFAERYNEVKTLDLTANDYSFLRQYMSQLPEKPYTRIIMTCPITIASSCCMETRTKKKYLNKSEFSTR